jgi:hypothetical protein
LETNAVQEEILDSFVNKYASVYGEKIRETCKAAEIRQSVTDQLVKASPQEKVSFHNRGFFISIIWNYCRALRSSPGFSVDQPPIDDNYTAELFAMVQDNGRILDDFKCVVGGTDILEAEFELSKIFNNPVIGAHTIKIQRSPRDLDLRKGLLSGNWKDVSTIVSCRDASIFDSEGGGILAEEFLGLLEDPENGKEAAAVRWAVRLSASEKLVIQLHGLPAAAAVLNGKPSHKR